MNAGCGHPAHRNLHLAPVPCPGCHGWLDRDGSPMSTEAMLVRFPFMGEQVAGTPAQMLPDYVPVPPSVGERIGYAAALTGRLAWTLITIICAVVAMALLIALLTHS